MMEMEKCHEEDMKDLEAKQELNDLGWNMTYEIEMRDC